jgi:hypothetical protein
MKSKALLGAATRGVPRFFGVQRILDADLTQLHSVLTHFPR